MVGSEKEEGKEGGIFILRTLSLLLRNSCIRAYSVSRLLASFYASFIIESLSCTRDCTSAKLRVL